VLGDGLRWLGMTWQESIRITPVLVAVYSAMLIFSTVVILRKEGKWKNPSVVLLVTVFLYVLLLPRFKDYSYILIIAPAPVVMRDFMRTNLARFLVVIFVCVNVFAYQPYYAAMLFFIVTLVGIRHVSQSYTMLRELLPNVSTVPSNNSTVLR
ncbi:MAG: hypothetical protein L0287_15190, partial [Anaerolineae bacterium]|nr:hypothetical protein [Anaerolineae bacterium]